MKLNRLAFVFLIILTSLQASEVKNWSHLYLKEIDQKNDASTSYDKKFLDKIFKCGFHSKATHPICQTRNQCRYTGCYWG